MSFGMIACHDSKIRRGVVNINRDHRCAHYFIPRDLRESLPAPRRRIARLDLQILIPAI